ncbi:MAG: CarD family transcriptional regulator, partial [Chlamydiia bacterium]
MSQPLSSLIDQLLACHGPRALQERLRGPGTLLFEQLWETPKAVIGTLLTRTCGTSGLWIIGQTQESRLSDDLITFGVKVLELPSWETMPHEQVPPSPDLVGQRMQTLHQLLHAKHSSEPLLVLAPLQSALQRVLPPQELARRTLQLRAGEEIPYERLITGLEEAGYRRVAVVSDKGEYAQRGALIDLFPISTPDPYRIEFLGDEIADIRLFDIASQKSRGQATQLLILPARELELLQECEVPGTIWDYLPKQSALLLDDLLAIEEHYVALKGLPGAFSRSFQTFDEWFAGRDETSRLLLFADRPLDQLSEVRLESAPEGKVVHFDWLGRGFTAFPQPAPFRSVSDSFHPDELSELPAPLALLDSVSAAQRELALSIAYLCTQEQDERQLRSWIDDLQIPFTDSSQILRGYLSGGLVSMEDHLAVIPTPEFTHRYKLRRQRQRSSYHAPELDIQELRPGDVVVHFHHGVGRFVGMETKTNHLGEPSEFLVLEFAERSRLYVPAHQAHLVTRYMGMEESTPAFHTLGASRWKKQREQTEKAIAGYAQQLLQLHAARQVHGGIAFPQDSSDLQLFEQNFPFDPTEDQQLAIDAVKQDMMRPQSMDRLICGDVGYGKT